MCKTTKKDSLLDLYLPHGDVYKLVDINNESSLELQLRAYIELVEERLVNIIINYKITLSK